MTGLFPGNPSVKTAHQQRIIVGFSSSGMLFVLYIF